MIKVMFVILAFTFPKIILAQGIPAEFFVDTMPVWIAKNNIKQINFIYTGELNDSAFIKNIDLESFRYSFNSNGNILQIGEYKRYIYNKQMPKDLEFDYELISENSSIFKFDTLHATKLDSINYIDTVNYKRLKFLHYYAIDKNGILLMESRKLFREKEFEYSFYTLLCSDLTRFDSIKRIKQIIYIPYKKKLTYGSKLLFNDRIEFNYYDNYFTKKHYFLDDNYKQNLYSSDTIFYHDSVNNLVEYYDFLINKQNEPLQKRFNPHNSIENYFKLTSHINDSLFLTKLHNKDSLFLILNNKENQSLVHYINVPLIQFKPFYQPENKFWKERLETYTHYYPNKKKPFLYIEHKINVTSIYKNQIKNDLLYLNEFEFTNDFDLIGKKPISYTVKNKKDQLMAFEKYDITQKKWIRTEYYYENGNYSGEEKFLRKREGEFVYPINKSKYRLKKSHFITDEVIEKKLDAIRKKGYTIEIIKW